MKAMDVKDWMLPFMCVLGLFASRGENLAEVYGLTQANFTQGPLSINYCGRVFSFNPAKPMNLVLVWHGGSGKGDDNQKQLTTYAVAPLLAYLEKNRINCVALFPQCPSKSVNWISGGDLSPMMATRALVRAKAREYRVSAGNTFFAGISMGGTAAYNLFAADVPNLFGKVVVCSARGDTALAPKITASARIFNGSNDDIVDPMAGKVMAEAIAAAGGTARWRMLDGYGHAEAAEVAFSDSQWDWFFRPTRGLVFRIQ